MLPKEKQNLAHEFIKRMALVGYLDFTKVTPIEKARIAETQKQWGKVK